MQFGFEDSIDTVFLDVEHNPLTRKPFFNECVFYARSARAVITADFFWNYPADVPLVCISNARVGKLCNPWVYVWINRGRGCGNSAWIAFTNPSTAHS
jgi:hypothetical protein